MKDYNKLLQIRIDKSFNMIIKVSAFITLLASILLFTAEISKIYALINFISFLILIFTTIFHHKITTALKIMTLLVIAMLIAIASYIGGGFASSFLTLLVLSNVIAIIFLSKFKSVSISIITLMILVFLCVYTLMTSDSEVIKELSFQWGLQFVAFILLLVTIHISVEVIKSYLIENIRNLEVEKAYSDQLAYYDTLTELPNTNKFKVAIYQQIKDEQTTGYVVYMSLKNLGTINSVLGHKYGDEALIEVTKVLNACKLKGSVIARSGGNEFSIWFAETDESTLLAYMEDLNIALNKQSDLMKKKLDFYMVYAFCDTKKDTLESALRKATLALTYAKKNNIRELISYNDILENTIVKSERLNDLIHHALKRNEIKLYYQGQCDSRSNKIIGYEGLARWESEELGLIMPNEFIPVIESLNMAVKFGEYVIDLGCQEYSKLQNKSHEEISLSINVSPNHIVDESIVDFVKNTLEKYNIPSHCLILEITENVIVEGFEKVKPIIKALNELNVKISLDDFGAGYSSLNYLARLELDEIKIDKSLIDQLLIEKNSHHILELIIYLANQLKLEIIAEGVEEIKQLEILSQMKCYRIQGYYYAKPMPLKDL